MCLTVAIKKSTKPWEILVQQRLSYERVIAFTDVLEATKKPEMHRPSCEAFLFTHEFKKEKIKLYSPLLKKHLCLIIKARMREQEKNQYGIGNLYGY